jgi:hypothetical protein
MIRRRYDRAVFRAEFGAVLMAVIAFGYKSKKGDPKMIAKSREALADARAQLAKGMSPDAETTFAFAIMFRKAYYGTLPAFPKPTAVRRAEARERVTNG